MKGSRVASAYLLVLAAAATANAQSLADQLRSAERERLRALVEADVEVAGRLHAEDFQLINPLGGSLTRAEYLGARLWRDRLSRLGARDNRGQTLR
jgi:hypothetical protein